eukprot:scaffold21446_cov22-Tisochrysis_lutea.AAC.3
MTWEEAKGDAACICAAMGDQLQVDPGWLFMLKSGICGHRKKGGAQEGMQGPFALAEALSMRPTLMPRMDTKQVTARIVRCAERKGPA